MKMFGSSSASQVAAGRPSTKPLCFQFTGAAALFSHAFCLAMNDTHRFIGVNTWSPDPGAVLKSYAVSRRQSLAGGSGH